MFQQRLSQRAACIKRPLAFLCMLVSLTGVAELLFGDRAVGPPSVKAFPNQAPPRPKVTPPTTAPTLGPPEADAGSACSPHLWASRDVGAVQMTGGSSYDNGVFTVSGTGWDIWERTDAFHFAYQPVVGDVEIVAHVVRQTADEPWAKAGVMLREELTSTARHAAVVVTPEQGIGFQQRPQNGGFTEMTLGPKLAAPVWLKLQRRGALVSSSYSVDGARWELIGTVSLNWGTSLYVGLAVTSHNTSIRNTAQFTDVTINGAAPFVLQPVTTQSPARSLWFSQDLGPVGQRGETRRVVSELVVRGAGYDIWDAVDAFHFNYLVMEGDGQIIARVKRQLNTDSWAKAGVMIRENLSQGARYAGVFVTPEMGSIFQQRIVAQRATVASFAPATSWLKLVRRCDSFSSYHSEDGQHWTFIGTQTVQMNRRAFVGLAVTSHVFGTLGEATFAEVSVTLTKPVTEGAAAQFYVAPTGSPAGDGSLEHPWDLATVLAQPAVVVPGSLIWVRGGIYAGAFVSQLTGTPDKPITVRNYAGERATLDGNGFSGNPLTVNGAHTVFWGLEVTNSNPDRSQPRAAAVNVFGPQTRFINLILHDANEGFGFWTSAVDAELYGNLIYNGGWQGAAPDRGHGHGIYTQNETGTKIIRDNIIHNQFGYGIHAYTEGGAIKGYRMEGNVSFNNGQPVRERTRAGNILIGGLQPAENITLIDNLTFHPVDTDAVNVQFFYGATANQDLDMRGNYFANGNATIAMRDWLKARFTRNVITGKLGLLNFSLPPNVSPAAFAWDNNAYYQSGPPTTPFIFGNQYLSFAEWRAVTGFDRDSVFAQGSGPVQVVVRPNQYEAGRAHVVVVNGGGETEVEAEVSQVIPVGARYEVRNAQDYWGAPVLSGTYEGGPLRLPLTGLSVAQPIGAPGILPTDASFNVFVLRQLP